VLCFHFNRVNRYRQTFANSSAKSISFQQQSLFLMQTAIIIKLHAAIGTEKPPTSPMMGQLLRPIEGNKKLHGEIRQKINHGAVCAKIAVRPANWRSSAKHECRKNKICRVVPRTVAPLRRR
jgi:hypothetical protein